MMKLNEANFYLAAMLRCPGIGCRYLQRLLEVMEDPKAIWQADARTLMDTKVLSPQLAKRLADFCRRNEYAPEEIQKVCEQKQIHTVSIL